jgi:hypothetical protein
MIETRMHTVHTDTYGSGLGEWRGNWKEIRSKKTFLVFTLN